MSAVGVEMRVTEDLAQAVLEHEREVDGADQDEQVAIVGTP